FGARRALQDLLRELERDAPGFGVFGLERWGTTSLLRRLRMEIEPRTTAWIDLMALPDMSPRSILAAAIVEITKSTAAWQQRPSGDDSTLEAMLHEILNESTAASSKPPVMFFDHIDEIVRPPAGSAEILATVSRVLYRLAMPVDGRARATIIIA